MMARINLLAVMLLLFFCTAASASVFVLDADGRDCKEVTFKNGGKIDSILRYTAPVDAEGKVRWTEPFIGLGLAPDTANWYGKGCGFMAVLINGRLLLKSSTAEMQVLDQNGKKGLVQYSWKDPLADVTLKVASLENDNKLMFKMSLDPKVEVRSILLYLVSYPMGMAAGKTDEFRDRRLATQIRDVQAPAEVMMGAGENWTFLYDGKVRETGPCAVMTEAGSGVGLKISLAQYAVYAGITPPADAREVKFALWEYPRDITWENGLETFRKEAGKAQQDLHDETFEPGAKLKITPK
ncbi:MAG: hypothetical protein PHT33_15600 [bacterium]|nr:hypothetical protein [bacterium]